MIPSVTCEIFLGQYVCDLVLVSMYLVWILGSKLIRSNNQSKATLWVLETYLIVRLLPFMIILITASLSSNTYNKASLREEFTFEGIKSTLSKSLIIPWDCCRVGDLHGSPRTWSFWSVFPWRTVRQWWSEASNKSVPLSGRPDLSSKQLNSRDLDFRNISSPGSLKLKTTRPMASSQ